MYAKVSNLIRDAERAKMKISVELGREQRHVPTILVNIERLYEIANELKGMAEAIESHALDTESTLKEKGW